MEVVVVIAVAAVVPAGGCWLMYHDYLRRHRDFVASVGSILEKRPLTAEAIDALAPVPPVLRRPRTPG